MSPKSFITLSVLSVFALFSALTMVAVDRKNNPAIEVGETAIPELLKRINDVEKIIIEHSKGKITLSSDDASWSVREISGYLARSSKIKRAILGLAQLKLSEPKTQLKNNYPKLELLDPTTEGAKSKRVYLFDKRGKTIGDIIVGKRRPSIAGSNVGRLYVRFPGKRQAWLAEGDVDISSNITEWLERKIINLNSKRIMRVSIRHENGEILEVYKKTSEKLIFSLKNIPFNKKISSETEPSTIGKALENLVLEDVKKEALVGPFSLKESLIADFVTFDGLTVRLHQFKRDEKFWIKIKASGNHKDAAIINSRTKGWIYKVADYSGSLLMRRMKDLIEDVTPKT